MNKMLSIFQAPDTCTCVAGWTGAICQTRKYCIVNSLMFISFEIILANCTLPCLNSGICVS
jgi:hypothetical protein